MPGALIEIRADGDSAIFKALSLYADVEKRQLRLYERMGATLVAVSYTHLTLPTNSLV